MAIRYYEFKECRGGHSLQAGIRSDSIRFRIVYLAGVEDAPFGYVNVFRAHVNVGFYQGSGLQDPAGLLEGNGKRMRHVKLNPGVSVDSLALNDLIADAYQDIQSRLEVERTRDP